MNERRPCSSALYHVQRGPSLVKIVGNLMSLGLDLFFKEIN